MDQGNGNPQARIRRRALLSQQLDSGRLKSLGASLGIDEKTVGTAVKAAMPLLMGALAQNARQKKGAEALQQAVERDHDGSVLDRLDDYVKKSGRRS